MGYPSIGPIYISTNSGATWTSNNLVTDCSCVASSADGNKLLAVSFNDGNGGFGAVWTSTDAGLNWTSNNIPYVPAGFFRTFLSAASSADGSHLLVGSYGSVLYNSTNSGLTWQTNNVPMATWQAVASSADGTRLIAAINNGKVYTSTNTGVTWTTNNLPSELWESVASSADGTRLAVVGSNIYSSTNSGTAWASNNAPALHWSSIAASADGDRMVASDRTGGIWNSVSTPSPIIHITPDSGNLKFSWLVPSANFAMQQSPDLISWAAVTNTPILNLTNLQNEILRVPSSDAEFYRLMDP